MTAEKKVKAEEASAKKQNQFVEVMKRLSYNKGAMFGLVLFVLVVLIAIFAPVLAPYDYAKIDIKAVCSVPVRSIYSVLTRWEEIF